jgi:hypothetical protein
MFFGFQSRVSFFFTMHFLCQMVCEGFKSKQASIVLLGSFVGKVGVLCMKEHSWQE